MATIQDTFLRIQEVKKKQREIRVLYREALKKSQSHQTAVEDLRGLREKKKGIEDRIRAEYARDLDKLDELMDELKRENEKLSDMVLSSYVRGEIVKVHDARNTVYDPIIKVSFKKSDEQ
ncbi:MAG: hypothetical protein AAB855_04635 [Patescibacteria group bacterium]